VNGRLAICQFPPPLSAPAPATVGAVAIHFVGSGVTYDALGNVSNDGFHSYTYDAEGRRVRGPSQEYVYDLAGHAVTMIQVGGTYDGVWSFTDIYAGGRHLATYSGGTTTQTGWARNGS
jgi:hypothetical protein